MPYSTAANSICTISSVADFLQDKSTFMDPLFTMKNGHFWGLGAMYTVHLRLTGKLVTDFLLVIIELFC